MEAADVLIDSSTSRALPRRKICLKCVGYNFVWATILKIKGELDQFVAGLDEAGVISAIKTLFETLLQLTDIQLITIELYLLNCTYVMCNLLI